MDHLPTPQQGHEDTGAELRFATLLYRFLFFDWLFADMTKAKNLFEQHLTWQHNRKMRRYLPVYLRRWAALTAIAFGLGCLFERTLKATVMAAWFFTWSSVMLTGMVVISVLWLFLSKANR